MDSTETDPIFLEALNWFAVLQDAKVSASDKEAFNTWINACPENSAAYARAQALWAKFDIVKPEYDRLKRQKALTRRSVMLGLCGIGIAGGALWALRFANSVEYQTDIAETKVIHLDDGSAVELGSYSSLSVDYTDGKRRLILNRGQAFFTVASDMSRPFIVEAGDATVQALGTQFDVKLNSHGIMVTVVEHSVLVNSQSTGELTLEEGWQIDTAKLPTHGVKAVDVEETQAWRRGRIIFANVPLRDVLEELERYTRGKIVLIDASIGDIPVTAVFYANRAEDALKTIEATLPIRVLSTAGLFSFVYRK